MFEKKISFNSLIKSLISSLNQTEDVAREHYLKMFSDYCDFDKKTNMFTFKEYNFQISDDEVVSLPEISLVEPSDFRMKKAEIDFDCRMVSMRQCNTSDCANEIEIELNPSTLSKNRMTCTLYFEQTNTSESYLKIMDALNNKIQTISSKNTEENKNGR